MMKEGIMKKLILILLFFTFSVELLAQPKKRQANSSNNKRTHSNRRRTANENIADTVSSETKEENDADTFEACMDNICKSNMFPDKGRCRCSSQLGRIEKILRDIEEIQNKADEENKIMETLMNVSNTATISDTVGSVYDNINSIEKRAKTIASQVLDKKTMVREGLPLYEEGVKQCNSFLTDLAKEDQETLKNEYTKLVETDCASYTTILKEKADTAQNLLVQAQKNREMFDEQEYKKLNQLDTNACYIEYEACAKTECGINFKNCKDEAKQETVLKKCQAVNYGKCEENKNVVLKDLKKFISKELEKVIIADNCKASLGHIKDGKCLFKVHYVADQLASWDVNYGKKEEVWGLPGQKFVCDDSQGSFKDLAFGCWESCYLVGPNGEKIKKGTNLYCKHPSFHMPKPAGWGTDGYPLNPDFRGNI